MALQYPIPLIFPEDYSRARYQVSACNQDAFTLATHFPYGVDVGAVVVGPKASGKTHLAHLWSERVHATPFAEVDPLAPLKQPVVIDDADARACADLFHVINNAKETGFCVLLTCSDVPAVWSTLPDLTSRLNSFTTAQLALPDEAMLAEMLQKYFTDQQLEVAPDVYHFLTARMDRSFASARMWAEKLNFLALSEKRAITVPLARRLFNKEVSTGL